MLVIQFGVHRVNFELQNNSEKSIYRKCVCVSISKIFSSQNSKYWLFKLSAQPEENGKEEEDKNNNNSDNSRMKLQ